MTQNLLDTTTILLNSTKSELNLGTSSKNYTETFSNGKSFNDILSTANNNLIKENKYSSNNLSKNNNFGNHNNNNSNNNNGSKKINESKTVKSDINNNVSNPNKSAQDTQKTSKQTKMDKVSDNNNTATKTDTTNSSNIKTSKVETAEESNTTTNISENDFTELNDNIALSDITLDSDIFSETEDLQGLEQMLLDEEVEDISTPADFYINAYYQSTIDSLQQVEITDFEQDTLIQDNLLQTTDLQNTNLLAEDFAEDLTLDLDVEENNLLSTPDVQNNLNTTTDTVDASKVVKQDLSADKTKLKSDVIDAKDAKKENILSDNQKSQTSAQNNEGVEVDTFTNEDNTINNDILVNVSDDVMQEVSVVNANRDGAKLSFREVMEKAGLDEAKLESLNLKVTNVSSGESDLGGNLGQGSAQEDITRLSLETQGKNNTQAVQSKDFSKIIDKKQIVEEQPKEISKNDILEQINSKMQAQNINGTKKITLQLTPESLGKITVEIMKGKDGLQAKMLTDNFQVKEMLEKNIDGLKATLSNQGVTVNNVSVKVASASESSSEFSFGRDNFNEENAQQQNFAGTGDRRGENDSQYERSTNSEIAMDDEASENISTEKLISEEEILSDEESEKIAVGTGNVDIEI